MLNKMVLGFGGMTAVALLFIFIVKPVLETKKLKKYEKEANILIDIIAKKDDSD